VPTADGDRSAVIIGAGIAGLATGLQLARLGWRVTLLERAPGPRGGAYVVGFSGVGYDAAERLDLVEELRRLESPWTKVRHLDGDGRVMATMDVESQRALLGGRMISILRGDLEQVLADALRDDALADRVELRFDESIGGIAQDRDGVTATLTDGSRIRADLLVGADGLHSTVRQLIFGPEEAFRYDLGALVASFAMLDPPAELAGWTTFLALVGRGAGVYPQRDDGLAVFFTFTGTSAPRERAERPAQTLRRVYGDLGWVWPQVLDRAAAAAESIFYDSISQIRLSTWSHGRVVLAGDAAWSVSLLAGHGSSLAVGGGELLGTLLDNQPDIPTALDAWERHLRPLVARKQRLGRRSRWLFIPRNRLSLAARSAAVRLAGSRPAGAVSAPLLGLHERG
jgi:2-polyprenyl-6-methoxyphenol hydroxylase-like FAD-dependent oxidoreductase